MNWNPGDRAEFYAPHSTTQHAYLHGTRCTIVSLTSQIAGRYTVQADECPYPGSAEWGGWACDPKYLKPIDDGFEAGSMDAIEKLTGWQPKELVRVAGKTATVADLVEG